MTFLFGFQPLQAVQSLMCSRVFPAKRREGLRPPRPPRPPPCHPAAAAATEPLQSLPAGEPTAAARPRRPGPSYHPGGAGRRCEPPFHCHIDKPKTLTLKPQNLNQPQPPTLKPSTQKTPQTPRPSWDTVILAGLGFGGLGYRV